MKEYIKKYEKWLTDIENLYKEKDKDFIIKFLEIHKNQIEFIQHERLIHLIITIVTSILFMLSLILYLYIQTEWIFIIPLIFLILVLFYIEHYCFLENTVQKWYDIYNNYTNYILTKRNDVYKKNKF